MGRKLMRARAHGKGAKTYLHEEVKRKKGESVKAGKVTPVKLVVFVST